jgi:hypothetical protein
MKFKNPFKKNNKNFNEDKRFNCILCPHCYKAMKSGELKYHLVAECLPVLRDQNEKMCLEIKKLNADIEVLKSEVDDSIDTGLRACHFNELIKKLNKKGIWPKNAKNFESVDDFVIRYIENLELKNKEMKLLLNNCNENFVSNNNTLLMNEIKQFLHDYVEFEK